MKVAVMVYHKDIDKYNEKWIKMFYDSIKAQTYQDFDIFELDYSGKRICIFYRENQFRYSQVMNNHIEAMNFLIDEITSKGYDIILNTNVDDFYINTRFEKQINAITNQNIRADLVSSNFHYVDENNQFIRNMDMYKFKDDIQGQLEKDHNVIAHPVIATRADFWKDFRYDTTKLGYEDLDLWQRTINTRRFVILPDYLLAYRIHKNQITANEKS